MNVNCGTSGKRPPWSHRLVIVPQDNPLGFDMLGNGEDGRGLAEGERGVRGIVPHQVDYSGHGRHAAVMVGWPRFQFTEVPGGRFLVAVERGGVIRICGEEDKNEEEEHRREANEEIFNQ